ncbi:MAG: nuclear transport factor 2 family protein [Sphingomonadales bacterium]
MTFLNRRLFGAAFGLAMAAFAPDAATAAGPSQADRNKAIVRAAFDAWQAGTGSPFDLLAEDARWTIEGNSVAAKTYPSREAFMSEVIRPFNARMKVGLKPAVREIYADGDTVIAFFDARGIARDDRPYVNTYAWFMEMRGGKIIRASAFFDAVEFNDLWARVGVAAH